MRSATGGSSAKSATPRSRSARNITQPTISAAPASGKCHSSRSAMVSRMITRANSAGGRGCTGRPNMPTTSASRRVW